jgi:hypothetical protein
MIKAFKFRAQAILSCWKDTPLWFTKFEFEKLFSLFYIISTQGSYIHQRLDTNSCFSKLWAISNLFSFFLYTLYTAYNFRHADHLNFPEEHWWNKDGGGGLKWTVLPWLDQQTSSKRREQSFHFWIEVCASLNSLKFKVLLFSAINFGAVAKL